jgi:hypothetical protein
MKPTPIINPQAIKASVARAPAVAPKAAFGDVMQGVSAMGPATAELLGQWTGGSNMAGAVLNAAFSGIEVAGGASSGGYGGYGAYSSVPGLMGAPRHGSQPGFTNAKYAGQVTTGVDDPSQYQAELMQTMNSNNLKLLELQALMQSNMQSWTTKSNILSADHRARMSMIEKFTARG